MENTILIMIYFFQLEEGDRRGHDQKLFKEIFRLDIIKYRLLFVTTGTHYPQVALIVKVKVKVRV